MTKLRFLSRSECGLCEELIRDLREHPGGEAIELEWLDVDTNPEWQRRYGLRIPVLLDAWGEVVCEGRFDADAFEAFLHECARRSV